KLERHGIITGADLLMHLPRRYEETGQLATLDQLERGDVVQTAHVRVVDAGARVTSRQHMFIVEARLEDRTGAARAVWFNQRFLLQTLRAGGELLVSGKVEWSRQGLTFRNPKFERVTAEQLHVGRLAPVYPETEKVSS